MLKSMKLIHLVLEMMMKFSSMTSEMMMKILMISKLNSTFYIPSFLDCPTIWILTMTKKIKISLA
uniref:Eukaryotic translation initiation factor 1A X-linked n=1 Tax=Macaca fascicularis TaxID=9541 RepID=I7G2N9_MACFA|nr:unnamed protein product [Macaca fascicularis]